MQTPLPLGEADAQRASGEGLSRGKSCGPHPTLSQWERDLFGLVTPPSTFEESPVMQRGDYVCVQQLLMNESLNRTIPLPSLIAAIPSSHLQIRTRIIQYPGSCRLRKDGHAAALIFPAAWTVWL